MSWCERHRINLATTASSCSCTAYTTGPGIRGRVQTVIYYKDGTAPFANNLDLTLTVVNTSQIIYSTTGQTASITVSPRIPVHNTTGMVIGNSTALSGAGSGGIQGDYIYIADDHIKVDVVSGGLSKVGIVDIIIS